MEQSNYDEIAVAVDCRMEFEGNSTYAVKTDNEYRVYSYSTLMLSIDFKTKDVYFDNRFYSVTTSRIQGIIAGSLPIGYGLDERYLHDFNLE